MAHVVLAGQVCGIPLRTRLLVCVGSPVSMLPLMIQPFGVPLGVAVGVALTVAVAVGVALIVAVAVGVALTVAVAVGVALTVAVADGDAVGVAPPHIACGDTVIVYAGHPASGVSSLTTTAKVCPLSTLNENAWSGSGLEPESPIQLVQMWLGSKLPR